MMLQQLPPDNSTEHFSGEVYSVRSLLLFTQTALHWAAKHGNKDMATLVANAGADVNTKSVSATLLPDPGFIHSEIKGALQLVCIAHWNRNKEKNLSL